MMTKTLAAVMVASALWAPLAAQSAVKGTSTEDSFTIVVDIPARTAAPTPPPTAEPTPAPTATAAPTPTTSSTATPAPAGPEKDAGQPLPGALPATGGEIALWAGALGLLALAAGLVIRARRRSRA